MTLAFVGAVAASQLPVMLKVGAAQKERAFSLTFDECEYWPKPGIIVAVARLVPAELQRLWRNCIENSPGTGGHLSPSDCALMSLWRGRSRNACVASNVCV